MSARTFRCSTAARWLPRVLAASLLAAALIVGLDRGGGPGRGVVLAGALAALWIVRQAGELRQQFSVDERGVVLRGKGDGWRLEFDRIESIAFAPPFTTIARPFPAALLIDAFGKGIRVSALIHDGGGFVERLVELSERDDLRAWAAARGVAARMRHARMWTAVGYGLAAAAWVGAVIVRLR